MFTHGHVIRGHDVRRLRNCWVKHLVSPTTVILIFTTTLNLALTEELCKQSDRGAQPYSLVAAARVIENLRRNSFDFGCLCGIL